MDDHPVPCPAIARCHLFCPGKRGISRNGPSGGVVIVSTRAAEFINMFQDIRNSFLHSVEIGHLIEEAVHAALGACAVVADYVEDERVVQLPDIVNGLDQAFWQSKVAPDVQGRVFANRIVMIELPTLVAMLLAGPLADNLFEPAMMPGGSWVHLFDWLVGAGTGAGMSLILVLAGFLGMLIVIGGYAFRTVRNAEDLLPDHDEQIISLSESVI